MSDPSIRVVTVTPNPAIDWTLTVPNFAAGRVNRVTEQRQKAGGKGVNVAASLAGYGLPVAATGFLGEDNAEVFEAFFGSTGIGDRFLRVPGSTRTGIKVVDPARQETTDINFPGAAPRAGDVDALQRLLGDLATPDRWFVLAGSLPPGTEPTLYRDLTTALKVSGCRVAVDSSGDALRHALSAAPHLVKPNLHELESLLGEQLEDREAVVSAARALVGGGVELAVVSMGAEGALFVDRHRAVLARPAPITVHSTVGAGDAMVAGAVAGSLDGLDLRSLARLATAFSMFALTGAGKGGDVPEAVRALSAPAPPAEPEPQRS